MKHKPSHPSRLVTFAALVVMALILTACGGTNPSATSPTTSTTAPRSTTSSTVPTVSNCSTGQLQVTAGEGSGAAGTISQVVLFENVSTTTCLLHAFPGVAGLDSSGNQLAQATRVVNLAPFTGSTASLPTVQLPPASTASATVFGSDVPVGAATSCVTYAALLVTPPNAFQSVRVDASLPGCAGLKVGPVYAGTTGMA
jgi:hypothetical protein